MILHLFSLLFIHSLQYLSLTPKKQTVLEVLHADEDLVTFTQFLRTDFSSSSLQNHGSVAILSPANKTLESFFASPEDKDIIQEHLTQNIARAKLSASGIQTLYFEGKAEMEDWKRLVKYEVIGGSCYTRESEYGTVRLTTSVYSKLVNLYEADSQVDGINVFSSESTGVIHVLEKPFLKGNEAPGFLNMTAEKMISESNINLLRQYDISYFLDGVIDPTTTCVNGATTTNVNVTTTTTTADETAPYVANTVQTKKRLSQRLKGLFDFSDKCSDFTPINQPLLNDTIEIESNGAVNTTVSQQNTSTTLTERMDQSAEKLKESASIPYFGSSKTLDLNYNTFVFKVVKAIICVFLHYKFILGLLTGLTVHPFLLPWIKMQVERRKIEDNERRQKRQEWIKMRIAALKNQSSSKNQLS